MNRRLVAAVVAALLAVTGGWLLLSYVQGADARAQAAEQLTPVLVANAEVPAGTPAEDLGSSVVTKEVPTRLVTDGVLTDLTSVAGLVTSADLLPGEMVQSGRFGDPQAARADGSLPAPSGTEEVSLTLERQRAAGGTFVPGDLAGVFGSFTTVNDGPEVSFELDGVVVTRVAVPADPDGVYTVTLALSPSAAASVSAAQSKGSVYLSLQAPGTPAAERIVDGSAVASGSSTSSTTTNTTASTGDNA